MSFNICKTLESSNLKPKKVAVMGPRPSDLVGYDDHAAYMTLKQQLTEIAYSLASAGVTEFVNDGSQGIAMLAFWSVDTLISDYHMKVKNHLYMPCEQQNDKWSEDGPFGNHYYDKMKSLAEIKQYHTTLPIGASYKDIASTLRGCDEAIIDDCDLLIAVYPSYDWMTQPKDETAASINYAVSIKKPVIQCLFDIKDGSPVITQCTMIK